MAEGKFYERIAETLAGLKDFQRATADYVFEQMWGRPLRSRMLIADEVGLGKTIVAKGLIAKAYGAARPSAARPFRVVYICSNQALARQNLEKLNFTKDDRAIDYSGEDDRLTALAYEPAKGSAGLDFSIKAFTPATSFDTKRSAGKADERVLLYRLLYTYKDMEKHRNSLKWILKGTGQMKDDNWSNLISRAEDFEKSGSGSEFRLIRAKVYKRFRAALEMQVSPDDERLKRCFAAARITYPVKYWTLLRNLCALGARRNNYLSSTFHFSKELISSLRFKLSECCVEFLEADIFVLDEFQRYKELIDVSSGDEEEEGLSPAIELARLIFSMPRVKVLMLSATPFKPYTNAYDTLNGEVHHEEFDTVLRFLLGTENNAEFWKAHKQDKAAFFSLLRHPGDITSHMDGAVALRQKLEGVYRVGMVRTERLLVSDNKSTMIERVQKPIELQPEDIGDFVDLDALVQHLNSSHGRSLNVPLEYAKSCPFPLSFLDNYAHKEQLRAVAKDDTEMQPLLSKSRHAWLNLKSIRDYQPLLSAKGGHTPNAKLRLLLEETVLNKGWQYLWVPPTMPYYKPEGAYKDGEGWSKTLLFSSWKMVPRMVASLVSYEAERKTVGNSGSVSDREQGDGRRVYFGKKGEKRNPVPQFTFKVEGGEPKQMPNFLLSYPSVTLAGLYDPVDNLCDGKSLTQIRRGLIKSLTEVIVAADLNRLASDEGSWEGWKWMAPLLLDRLNGQGEMIGQWLLSGAPDGAREAGEHDDANEHRETDERESGRARHFRSASEIFHTEKKVPVGKMNAANIAQLAEHLADVCLGSPAVAVLRTLRRYYEEGSSLYTASYLIATSLLALLNKPESIAIVRLTTGHHEYWRQCLEYLADGNLQAMLDEYVYMLRDSENQDSPEKLTSFIQTILGLRTAPLEVEGLREFQQGIEKGESQRRPMRTHYAVAFGAKINVGKGAKRDISLRQAFNSPFRPFVLATTSVGQEGLDFHFYCRKIFHWNLPSNPIDFEQREGRIHRYKGLVIRQNLAVKWGKEAANEQTANFWDALFKKAESEREPEQCELIPFWHTKPLDGLSIQRYVPLYPFSHDRTKYEEMIRVLTFYRLTFGQPRQDELMEALESLGADKELHKQLYKLIIDLSPISFTKVKN